MPEILTKYPDDLKKILRDAHIKCGTGEPQQILVNCPKEQFCSFPTGEMCIYSTKDIANMTQMSFWDTMFTLDAVIPLLAVSVLIFVLGMFLGMKIANR